MSTPTGPQHHRRSTARSRDLALALGEDHRQVRTRNGPANLSVLTTLAINTLRLNGYTNMAEGRDDHILDPMKPMITYGLL